MTRTEINASVFGVGRNPVVQYIGALCTYREARGETSAVQFAQACSVINRVLDPKWWGIDILSVVLKPWQYSSFNSNDPNNMVWPLGVHRPNTNLHGLFENRLLTDFIRRVMSEAVVGEQSAENDAWYSCLNSFNNAVRGLQNDPTSGATHYYDKSIGFPDSWGEESNWVHTLTIGRLLFWKGVTP